MAQEKFQNSYDYIIVGGGLAGCVLGARLREKMHNSSILIIEAGPDCVGHPLTSQPLACFGARKCSPPQCAGQHWTITSSAHLPSNS